MRSECFVLCSYRHACLPWSHRCGAESAGQSGVVGGEAGGAVQEVRRPARGEPTAATEVQAEPEEFICGA